MSPPECDPLPLDDFIVEPPPHDRDWIKATVIATGVSLFVMLVMLVVVNHSQDATVHRAARSAAATATQAVGQAIVDTQVAACDRSQLKTASERLLADLAPGFGPTFDYYNPIVDCSATYRRNHGKAVPLQASTQRCFIRLVKTHFWLVQQPPAAVESKEPRVVTTNPAKLKKVCA